MGSGARFWRNVAIIGGVHLALLIAFVRWGSGAKTTPQQQVIWLSGENLATASSTTGNGGSSGPAAFPTPEPHETPEPEEQPTIAPAKSEIQWPMATPTPTSTPRPIVRTSPPPPKPASSARPTPRPISKKSSIVKVTPKPKPKATPDEDNEPDLEAVRVATPKIVGPGSAGAGGIARGGTAKAEVRWYGRMLHDRFHNAWDQPTTVVASGAKISALVKARIEQDGRVSRFEIVKPSGNVVVDESVRAVASKVTQVDPLPNGVGNGEHYDVTINFELNPEE